MQADFRTSLSMVLFCLVLAGCQATRFADVLTRSTSEGNGIAQVRFGLGSPIAPACPTAELIDLETALRLAGVENPNIALAEEVVRARLAERMQARALLFPSLDAGANVRVHRGVLQTVNGTMFETNSQSLYYGFGADAKGSGTVAVPGLRLIAHLGDAVY